ncbi:histidinol-phosphate transaminase [Suttonella ornithocola]|uniref:Histidinol-phosphate aminotransferase n=1 Tax=Suttonella ornithocola TaxID=279832 RepID=A0A380MWF9_9GAMM|nr:histidinol-phosphate transaminase [Suttonella ornithocola]SUO96612.1 Histidinol-phosphate aminotransferase 2 [Suttonella ornithocola]
MNYIEKVISPQVREAKAYAVADIPTNMLKLDAMELPCDLPENLREKWLDRLKNVALNRYPPAVHPIIENLLKQHFNISENHDVLFGNGSDELIQIILLASIQNNRYILAPAPTFVMYELLTKFLGMQYIGVDTKSNFELDLPAMLKAIDKYQPAVIFLAHPNNPTGKTYPSSEIIQIIEKAEGLVVIDEAYLAYSEGSLKAFAEQYDNVVIMRTLSKTGFAGIRFGYLFGKKKWIHEFNKVRAPYNVNVLTQATIQFVLENYSEIVQQSYEIKEEREKIYQLLKTWDECQIFPSQANFLVLRVPNSQQWFEKLKSENILVKNLNNSHPLLENCLRLTISNHKENIQLMAALEKCR